MRTWKRVSGMAKFAGLLAASAVSLGEIGCSNRTEPPKTIAPTVSANAKAGTLLDRDDYSRKGWLGPSTGKNGLEELNEAQELTQGDELHKAVLTGTPIAEMRRATASPRAKRIFALIEEGAAKPIRLPADTDTFGYNPAFSLLRSIGRSLRVRLEVDLADGRMHEAANAVGLGLKLARSTRSRSIVGAINAKLVAMLVIVPTRDRIEDLPAADCRMIIEELRGYCLEPGVLTAMLHGERRSAEEYWKRSIAHYKTELYRTARDIVLADHDYLIRNIEKPLASWPKSPTRPVTFKPDKELAEIVGFVIPVARNVVEHSGVVRLIGVKFAIELHRKTHGGELPKSLADLKIGEMAIDPVTGKPFQYVPGAGGKYTLVGAKAESVLTK